MQASLEDESELTFHPTDRTGFSMETATERLEIIDKSHENDENDENNGNEGDFTFSCPVDDDASSSTAEEIFHNGKIRPVFPLFDQSLVELPHQLPPVKNVFVGAARQGGGKKHNDDEEEAAGPYCAWSSKAQSDPAASSPVECKKSNSTGFSKLWRFKEMTNRSNSDGRDTFVFLNKQAPDKQAPAKKTPDKQASDKKASDKQAESVFPAVANSVKATAGKTKVGGKGKTTTVSSSVSAHEVYVKSKAASREEDRRRTYLPYKPELVGFFTNVNGGMSKNVHPF